MKIVHPKINSKIEISDHEISVLVVEEPEFFYELLMDIKSQINNFGGKFYKVIRYIKSHDAGMVKKLYKKNRVEKLLERVSMETKSEKYG